MTDSTAGYSGERPNRPNIGSMHYTRPPISEAVIDIHTEFQQPPSMDQLQAVAGKFADSFPLKQLVNTLAFSLSVGPGQPDAKGETSSSSVGLRLSSSQNDRVLQLLRHGIAYSHLPPYSEWDTFLSGMQAVWPEFVKECGVTVATRMAVRYINRLSVPQGSRVEDYLELGVRIPEKVSQHVIGYFAQIVLPLPELGPLYRAVVNTGVEPGAPEGPAVLLLDIDVFYEGRHDVQDPAIWHIMQALREKKNAIFEGSITNKVRNLIQ